VSGEQLSPVLGYTQDYRCITQEDLPIRNARVKLAGRYTRRLQLMNRKRQRKIIIEYVRFVDWRDCCNDVTAHACNRAASEAEMMIYSFIHSFIKTVKDILINVLKQHTKFLSSCLTEKDKL